MKKHKKSIIGVVLMVLITLGVYILFKGDGNSVFTGDDTTQAVEFNDINLNEEKDGKVIWNLKARHVKMESDRNTAYLTDIEGFFAEDGNELSIKAKKGIIKRAEQTVNLEGDIEGSMLFVLENNAAHHLVHRLMGSDGSDVTDEFTEMELSALLEIGNIIAGAYLTAISQLTNLSIIPTVPSLAVDMAGAILSVPAIEFGKLGDKALLIESQFRDEEMDVCGYFILIPTMESYAHILNSLGM